MKLHNLKDLMDIQYLSNIPMFDETRKVEGLEDICKRFGIREGLEPTQEELVDKVWEFMSDYSQHVIEDFLGVMEQSGIILVNTDDNGKPTKEKISEGFAIDQYFGTFQ